MTCFVGKCAPVQSGRFAFWGACFRAPTPLWIGLRRKDRRCWAGVGPAFVPSRAGQAPPFHQPLNTPHFVTGMPLGEQIALAGHRDRSNFARDSLSAPRSRSKESLPPPETAKKVKVVNSQQKARFAVQTERRRRYG